MQVLAYIDPGAGSLLIQALIAGLLSIPFFFRTAIRSTLQRLRRGPESTEKRADTPADAE
jgi:hypothetical protein